MRKPLALLALTLLVLTACREKSPAPSAKRSPFEGTSGYILSFGSDFKPGMNRIDDFGISVVIAVDISGSMGDAPRTGGSPKYVQAANALRTVATYLENLSSRQKDLKIQVGIIKFSSGVDTVLPLTKLDQRGLTMLNDATDPVNFTPAGKTAIGRAMELGTEMLAQSGTIFNSLIVITDGENNIRPEPGDVMKAIYSNRNSATTEDVKVTTSSEIVSFVGFDVRSSQFEQFHELGARITSADSQTEIEESLKSLLEADITKLESR